MEEIQQQQAQAAAAEERRLSILDQILEPAAKERLSRMAIVKKEKARSIEDSLIRGATNGQLKSKVSVHFVCFLASAATIVDVSC
jgi:programmed cell death protein 5